MSTITIDRDRCLKDGICRAVCPFKLFRKGKDGIPAVDASAAQACMACGHCLAACPSGAIRLDEVSADSCAPAGAAPQITEAQVFDLFQTRRSIRAYRRRPVDRETLSRLLEITRWSPTAKNAQSVRWIVFERPETVHELAGVVVDWYRETGDNPGLVMAWEKGVDMVHRGAPHLIVAHADARGLKPSENCVIALTGLELAASALGLGACWAGFFMNAARNHPPLIERLELPEHHEVYGALMLGHPKYRYPRIPPRRGVVVRWR